MSDDPLGELLGERSKRQGRLIIAAAMFPHTITMRDQILRQSGVVVDPEDRVQVEQIIRESARSALCLADILIEEDGKHEPGSLKP